MREHQEKVPFLYILEKFQQQDLQDLCQGKGLNYDEKQNVITVNVMSENYDVFYPSGKVFKEDGREVTSYLLKTVLLRYLVNGKGTKPTFKFISYKEIKDGQVYYPNFYKRTIQRLAQLYEADPDLFDFPDKLERIPMPRGDLAFAFEFLPNVYFQFILYRGDDEFPASANILMDANIEDYFNAEDLAVVVDIAIEYFVHKGTIPPDLGMYHFKESC
ncbi:MAG: DUF3786 domain-containing protein [Firmicutes bacterium]|nr:DUF3786 domain-containing protein [Bacillota bacterium]